MEGVCYDELHGMDNLSLTELSAALDALLAERPCYTLKDLAVNGTDLLALGYRGKAVGETLDRLLRQVMDGRLPNDRQALLDSLDSLEAPDSLKA